MHPVESDNIPRSQENVSIPVQPRLDGTWLFGASNNPPDNVASAMQPTGIAPPYANMNVVTPVPPIQSASFGTAHMHNTDRPSSPVNDQPILPPPGLSQQYGLQHPVGRQQFVEQIYTHSQPPATAQLHSPDGVNLATSHVPAFAMINEFRDRHTLRQSQPRAEEHPAMPWEHLTQVPGLAFTSGLPQLPTEHTIEFSNQPTVNDGK